MNYRTLLTAVTLTASASLLAQHQGDLVVQGTLSSCHNTQVAARAAALSHRGNVAISHRLQQQAQQMLAETPAGDVQTQSQHTAPSLSIMVTLDANKPLDQTAIEALGGQVVWSTKTVAYVVAPADVLEQMAAVEGVVFMKEPEMMELDNKNSRAYTHVNNVVNTDLATQAGLPGAFTGQGVILGVVDTGIEFGHINFRDDTGKTRIAKVFNYPSKSLPPNISQNEWRQIYTDPNEIVNLIPNTDESHGSHVMGSAGGSYSGNGQQGMAPEATLVPVNVQVLYNVNTMDGINQIINYGAEQGKPVVINMSFGRWYGFHDGQDAFIGFEQDITENGTRPGVILVHSAGNEGSTNASITHVSTGEADTTYFMIESTNMTPTKYFSNMEELYIRHNSTNSYVVAVHHNFDVDTEMELVCYDLDTKQVIRDEYVLIASIYYDVNSAGDYVNLSLKNKGSQRNGYFSVSPSFLHELMCTDGVCNHIIGEQRRNGDVLYYHEAGFDNLDIFIPSNMRLGFAYSGVPAGGEFSLLNLTKDGGKSTNFITEGIPFVTPGDPDYSINEDACSDAEITVGAFCVTRNFTSIQGENYHWTEETSKKVASFSSYGKIYDGTDRIKPDILAPGVSIVSSTNRFNTKLQNAGVIDETNALITGKVKGSNGITYYWQCMNGTSMASPTAAGIIALWMQAAPTMCINDVREVCANSCIPYTDESVHPWKRSRYGNIDAMAGLQYIYSSFTGIQNIVPMHEPTDKAAPVYRLDGSRAASTDKPGLYFSRGMRFMTK